MKHRIGYEILGAGTGNTSYRATCTCGWTRTSTSPGAIADAGPAHVMLTLDSPVPL